LNQRLITPSKITAWLDCAHYLTLRYNPKGAINDARRTVAELAKVGK